MVPRADSAYIRIRKRKIFQSEVAFTLRKGRYVFKSLAYLLIFALLLSPVSLYENRAAAADPESVEYDLQSGKQATASSSQAEGDSYAPGKAIDGDAATRWAAGGPDKPQWLKVDLGAQYEIRSVLTAFEFNNSYYQYVIEVSDNDEDWTKIADRSASTEQPGTQGYVDEAETNARYVRITVTDTQYPVWVSIREFRINPQMNDVVSASSEFGPAYAASMAFDGDPATRWAADGNEKPQWLMVRLADAQQIRTIATAFEANTAAMQYLLETSWDGSDWQTFADRTANAAPPDRNGAYWDEGNVMAKYVRITVTGAESPELWASIWELTINPADGPTATASSEMDATHSAAKAIDGSSSTRWSPADSSKPQWLLVDLGSVQPIRAINTEFEFNDSYYQYRIEGSDDQVAWTTFTDRSTQTQAPGVYGYTDRGFMDARYVRITVTGVQHEGMWVSIREFKINPASAAKAENDDLYNVALGKTATASSTMSEEFAPAYAMDGNTGTTRWSPADREGQHWLQVDLGREYYIQRTLAIFEWPDVVYQYRIETSLDGEQWSTFADKTANALSGPAGYIDEGGVWARHVRITGTDDNWKSLFEFQVFGTDNLAAGRPATASSEQDGGHAAALAFDGSRETGWSAAEGEAGPQWLQVDLGESAEIGRIETYLDSKEEPYRYRLDISDDETNWSAYADRSGNTVAGNPGYTDKGIATARYVRLTFEESGQPLDQIGVRELRVYAPAADSYEAALVSGAYELKAEALPGGKFGIGVYKGGERMYGQRHPQQLLVKEEQEQPVRYEAAYDSVEAVGGALILRGIVGTNYRSLVAFEDTYRPGAEPGAFDVLRSVTVVKGEEGDQGYNTVFGLMPDAEQNMEQFDMLAPGNWYGKNDNVVNSAIASDYSHDYFYIREMRLALPFFTMRNDLTGETLSIGRPEASPTSGVDETVGSWLVDDSLNYGSLGIHKQAQPSLDFVFPGLEGEINYVNHGKPWVYRSHPVTTGAEQQYELTLRFSQTDSYPEALNKEWHAFLELLNPQLQQVNVQAVYDNAIDLLDEYAREYNGIMGLPFKADVPDGEIGGYAMVMGFVGQQLPAAYQMIRYALNADDDNLLDKGVRMVDFWASRSMTPSGLPKTWFEPFWGSEGTFTSGDADMRTMSDGMEGAVDAYRVMQEHGVTKSEWLDFAASFGDWLVANQNDDGSYYRIYGFDSKPVHTGKFNTTNPIRFLIKLYGATGERKYLDAAEKAGDYAYANIYEPSLYVGGTSDNNNTIDKEAGVMAMNAFLSLYDATKDAKWVEALRGAADYTATWTFAWTYETPAGGTRWAANGDSKPQWLQVDLGEVKAISSVETYMEYRAMGYQYTIDISEDGHTWTRYADRSNNVSYGNPSYVDSGNADARYVRLNVTGTEAAGAWVSVWEFVVKDADGNNLALHKPTTASSSAKSPKFATDGNIDSSPLSPFPEAGLIGQSFVATGHSYVDQFMAYMGSAYYRLYLLTNDEAYLRFAKLLQNNANYTTDWKGSWGYAYPGLVEEGGNVTELVYSGIGAWLVWNSVAQLEPLSLLEDRFGSMSIEEIEQLPLAERQLRNGQSPTCTADCGGNGSENGGNNGNNGNTGSNSGNNQGNSAGEAGSGGDDLLAAEQLLDNLLASPDATVSTPIGTDGVLKLPVNAGGQLQKARKALQVTSEEGGSVVIPASVLAQLHASLSAEEREGAAIEIVLRAAGTKETGESRRIADEAEGSVLQGDGALFVLELRAITGAGRIFKLDRFGEPVVLSLPLPKGIDARIAGVYRLNEELKKWEYSGGDVQNGQIAAQLLRGSAYAALGWNKKYSDVPASFWGNEAIRILGAKHIAEGTGDSFDPQRPVTRAEFAALLGRALRLPEPLDSGKVFDDVDGGVWYDKAVATAIQAGLIQGVDDSRFAPDRAITREEMAVILVRAYERNGGIEQPASGTTIPVDAAFVSGWAKSAVNKAIASGLMAGRGSGIFAPAKPGTRAEAAQAIFNLLGK